MRSPIVELREVTKSYRLGETIVPALRGVSLELHAGEFAAVVGASGSGKTTLLNLIGCIDDPDAGTVHLDGADVGRLGDDDKSRLRNRRIGFVFQSFNLVPVLTVAENVELPLLIHLPEPREKRRQRVEQALADVGLSERAGYVPDKLSGGERQRVAIARALVTRPALVLADEPTANLDSANTDRIVELMRDLNERRQTSFLFSTHDERVTSRVKRTLRIRDGKIHE